MKMRGSPDDLKRGTHPWYEKGYAGWTWVRVDQVVSKVPSELIYAHLSLRGAGSATIYDGDSTSGNVVVILQDPVGGQAVPLDPPEPILCPRGIYVDVGSHVDGVLVMWRPLPAGWRP